MGVVRLSPPAPLAFIGGAQSSIAAFSEYIREMFVQRTTYAFQHLSTRGILVKLCMLMACGIPFVFLFGAMYKHTSGCNWNEALYKCYALIYRVPGIGLAKESSRAAYIVANMVFFVGMFSFAVLLGIISDEIKTNIKNVRSGNYAVRQANHLLLINWNAQTLSVLRQIAIAQQTSQDSFWKQAVVVLADKPKAEMDAAIADTLRGYRLEVHTRQGNPAKMNDLRKVAGDKARTVILMHPEKVKAAENAESLKASAAMCLTAIGADKQQQVVVQMPDINASSADADVLQSLSTAGAVSGRNFQLLQLPDKKLVNRLTAQTAAQPGVLTSWLNFLQHEQEGSSFRIRQLPAQLQGKRYQDIRRAYMHAVVCGYVHRDESTGCDRVLLNPREDAVPAMGDRLVLLVQNGNLQRAQETYSLYSTAADHALERYKKCSEYKSKPRNIIVANWEASSIADLMSGFSDFTPTGTVVSFVNKTPVPDSLPFRLGNCRFQYLTSDAPLGFKTLSDAGIKHADAVVIGDNEALPDSEADAAMLAGLLKVQDAVLRCKRKDVPHVVARIRKNHTAKLASTYLSNLLAEVTAVARAGEADGDKQQLVADRRANILHKPELMMPNDVISALLTQVAAEPDYSIIMRELLFSNVGSEMYLRNPAALAVPLGVTVTFAEVEELARLSGQTALGYIRADCTCVMAPSGQHTFSFAEGDKVVTLAEEY